MGLGIGAIAPVLKLDKAHRHSGPPFESDLDRRGLANFVLVVTSTDQCQNILITSSLFYNLVSRSLH
jgi:hypothetical protein